MSAPVEDVRELPGKKVSDQDAVTIGEIKEVYAIGGDGHPTWVMVDARPREGRRRPVFIPLAPLKIEDDELRVPYSAHHIVSGPEVEPADELSAEDENALRSYYSVGVGDQELRSDNRSYAALVPEQEGSSRRVQAVDALETPSADKRTEETKARLEDPGRAEIRRVTADDVIDEDREHKNAD